MTRPACRGLFRWGWRDCRGEPAGGSEHCGYLHPR